MTTRRSAIWRNEIGLPENRIQARGLADNYWHMGVPGPGGPCSEIYYDRGPEYGRDGGPAADEDRFLEVWNLVFMQDQLSKVRAKDDFDIEGPLPSRNVDTGMGLERMASILQGVDNLYEIDTTWKILDRAAELTEQNYGREPRAPTWRCGSSPTTCAARSCWSRTACCPATRAAATCCGASCGAASGTCACWPAASAAAAVRPRPRASASCPSSPRSRSRRWPGCTRS